MLTTYLSESGEKVALQTETICKKNGKLLTGSPTITKKCRELDVGKSSDMILQWFRS